MAFFGVIAGAYFEKLLGSTKLQGAILNSYRLPVRVRRKEAPNNPQQDKGLASIFLEID